MKIDFKRLPEIAKEEVIDLLDHPLVRKHMPLAKGPFDDKAYEAFIADKEGHWKTHGYGPWALVVDGSFVGWGGIQDEEGEADLALVLHPNHWGLGRVLYEALIEEAFQKLGFSSVTILLPPSRIHLKGLFKLGFQADGESTIKGERFIKYRLLKDSFN